MFNHAPEDYNCPFCLLEQGIENEPMSSVQTDIIYHNQSVTALISSHQWPNNPGNVIIIPNEHYENIYDLPIHFVPKIHALAKAMAIAMKMAFTCDGVSTRQHNEPAGNQDVWHYHLHVTPRYKDDNFYTTHWQFMPADERVKYTHKLKAYLGD